MASGDVHQRRITDVPGRITALGLRSSNATLVDPPAVAIGLAGQGKTRGTAALVERRLCTNQSVALISGDGQNLLTSFLFHDLDYRYEELRARSSGGGRGGLSKSILEQIPLLLPPLLEQRRIAEILDTVDDAILCTERLIAKLELMNQGLLRDLLTRGIDDNGELRDPRRSPELFRETALGVLPATWNVAEFGIVIEEAVDGPFGSNLKTEHYVETAGVRVVRLQNIGNGVFEDRDRAYVKKAHADRLSRHSVRSGDLLIASLGDDNHPFARSCIYPDSEPDAIVKADCFRLRLDTTLAMEHYVMHVLNCPITRRGLRGLAQGVTRDRVNLASLRRFMLALPPINEQRQICSAMTGLSKRVGHEETELVKLRLLKQGLANDLLTGRVLVNLGKDTA
jgi:type I restriction enzyme S subunit